MRMRSSLWHLSWGTSWFELQAPLSETINDNYWSNYCFELSFLLCCNRNSVAQTLLWKRGPGALQGSEEIHCSVNQVLSKLVAWPSSLLTSVLWNSEVIACSSGFWEDQMGEILVTFWKDTLHSRGEKSLQRYWLAFSERKTRKKAWQLISWLFLRVWFLLPTQWFTLPVTPVSGNPLPSSDLRGHKKDMLVVHI